MIYTLYTWSVIILCTLHLPVQYSVHELALPSSCLYRIDKSLGTPRPMTESERLVQLLSQEPVSYALFLHHSYLKVMDP